jgi:hypothetical protein
VRAPVAVSLAAAGLLASACGSTTTSSETPWAPSHPDPQNIHFAAAQGLCRITVRYPADAPGEIDTDGGAYIQRDRSAPPSPPTGTPLGTSGDWKVYRKDAHTVLLVTPDATFSYQDGANCGSNSAAPT